MSRDVVDQSAAVGTARRVSEWLLAELPTLSPEQWEAPEACGIWSAADVAAHVLWVVDMYDDGIRRALTDDTGRPSGLGLPANRPDSLAPRAWQEIWSEMPASRGRIPSIYRQDLGDRVPEALASWSNALVSLIESLTPTDWGRPTFHPAGILTARQMCCRFVLEMGVHGWDILHRSRRDVVWPEASALPMLDVIHGYIRGSFVPRERLTAPERYRFELGPTVPYNIRLDVLGDSWSLGPERDDEAVEAVLTTDPQTYILLCMGRVRWRTAAESGALKIAGPQHVVATVPAWFGLD